MSARRRARGDGTIYRDAALGRWVGQLDDGRTAAGKRRRIKVIGTSRAEVADKLRRRQVEVRTRAARPRPRRVRSLL